MMTKLSIKESASQELNELNSTSCRKWKKIQFRKCGRIISKGLHCRIHQNNDELQIIADEMSLDMGTSTVPKQAMFSIIGASKEHNCARQYFALSKTLFNLRSKMQCYLVTSCRASSVIRIACEGLYKNRASDYSNRKSAVIVGMSQNNPQLWSRFSTLVEDSDHTGASIYDIPMTEDTNTLSPYHDYYYLLDGNKTSDVYNLRLRLERQICTSSASMSDILRMYFLVGGDFDDLEYVDCVINAGYPVMIIAGTRGAADILTNLLEGRSDLNASIIEASRYDPSWQIQNVNLDRLSQIIYNIGSKRNHVYIHESRHGEAFNDKIFEFVKSVNSKTLNDEYRVRLFWCNVDDEKLTQDLIFTIENYQKENISVEYLLKCGFLKGSGQVILLLANSNFMSYADIFNRALEWEAMKPTQEILSALDWIFEKGEDELSQSLTVNALDNMYRFSRSKNKAMQVGSLTEAGQMVEKTMGYGYANPYDEIESKANVMSDMDDVHVQEPFRDLFIWALFSLRLRIALLIWKRLRHPTSAALVAYKILSNQADETYNQEEKEMYQSYANKFMDLACEIANKVHYRDRRKCRFMMLQEVVEWGKVSTFSIIALHNMPEIIQSDGYINALEAAWGRNIDIDIPNSVLLTSCMLPIPLASWYIFNDQNRYWKIARGPYQSVDRRLLSRLYELYDTPLVKFRLTFLVYVGFTVTYAVFLIRYFYDRLSPFEIVIAAWLIGSYIEDILMNRWKNKLKWSFWDILSHLMLIIFIVCINMRIQYTTVEISRMLYCVNFVVICIRILQILSPNRKHGPKLIMIWELVSSHAILYPNGSKPTQALSDILLKPFYALFGELSVDETLKYVKCPSDAPVNFNLSANPLSSVYGNGTSSTSYTFYNCMAVEITVNILLAFYLVIAVILLLNLLIAIMNKSYDKLEEEAKLLWASQMTGLVLEYTYRSPIVSPFSILLLPMALVYATITGKCIDVRIGGKRNNFSAPLKSTRDMTSIEHCLGSIEKEIQSDIIGDSLDFIELTKADRDDRQDEEIRQLKEELSNIRTNLSDIKELLQSQSGLPINSEQEKF
ncbi:Transient receptor potential cation channel subfamily M member 1 [Trichoplax sp. H2]|nr:Transient receptor potential cation channel subfamily M member 1 [Trichoplax sp. H2]|eukprot:RDD42199.1 Transient receptor potential cation channel subfamily M member 1 [Trichoplax sp. H2]